MFGCKHAVGNAEKRVATGSEYGESFVCAVYCKVDFCAYRFAYPIALSRFRGLAPIEFVQTFKQSVGILLYIDYPLLHIFANDGVAAALALSVYNFVVGEYCAQLFAPVHGSFNVAGKPFFNELFKKPLRPLVVGGVAGGNGLLPIVGKAQHFKLFGKVFYVFFRKAAGVVARLYGVLFGGQTETVETDGVQNVVALHTLHTRYNVGGGVAFGVPHVQARARGIGEHIQNIVFRFRKIAQIGVEGLVFLPISRPFFFYFGKVGVRHKFFLKNFI